MAELRDPATAAVHAARLAAAGQFDAAAALCQAWLARAPQAFELWFELGSVHLRRGAAGEAEAALRQAASLAPQQSACWNNLSVALCALGRAADAEAASRRALALEASVADHWVSLGNALYSQQQWAGAADAFRESLAREPNDPDIWSNLGAAEQRQDNLAAAEQAYARGLALAPQHASTLVNFAYLLCLRGQPRRAIELLAPAMQTLADMPGAWIALGNACKQIGEFAQAETHYRQALRLTPGHREARYRLALVQQWQWQLAEAESLARSLAEECPHSADAWGLLGSILQATGQSAAGAAALARSIELEPNAERHSQLLLALQYVPAAGRSELLAAHRRWDEAHAQRLLTVAPPPVRHSGGRPLRVGLVSADFGRHPTGFLVLPAIEHLDKQHCEVVCYADRIDDDEYTRRFRQSAAVWRVTLGMTAAELADQIRDDEIEVLIDLMGHAGKRLLVFARRPAPRQATWFGYVGTTGLAAMDGLLADRYHVRPGEESDYAERILWLPQGYACYGPPAAAPDVAPLPALATGHMTFGCFNNPAKYSPPLLDAWAAILARVPHSRLLLKFGGLDQPELAGRICSEFARRGVEAERIVLEGNAPHSELLATYGRVDLALDTQPYSGGLTTCEALWMGVPVITFPGQTFAGRHALSYLANAGLPQFCADDAAGYVELAATWAGRQSELADLRQQLRGQLRQSPVCDAARFAGDLLELLRQFAA